MLDARFVRSRRKRGLVVPTAGLSVAFFWLMLTLQAARGVLPVARADQELSRVGVGALSLEVGGAFVLAGSALLLSNPRACHWCEPPAFDQALARPVAPKDRVAAGRMSHVFSYVALPVVTLSALAVPPLTTSERDAHAFQNVAIGAEVVLFDLALTAAIKTWVGRRRPAFYYGRVAYTEYRVDSREANVSFFSGDTSAAFAAASAAATISFQRGYGSAPYVTAAGATFATATGLLRIGADVHWASDVLTGALVGTALGIAMPLLLHPRAKATAAVGGGARELSAQRAGGDAPMLRFSAAF